MIMKLMTFDEASEHIRSSTGLPDITPQWVRSQVDQGKLGSVTVAGKRRVRLDRVDAMIQKWIGAAA